MVHLAVDRAENFRDTDELFGMTADDLYGIDPDGWVCLTMRIMIMQSAISCLLQYQQFFDVLSVLRWFSFLLPSPRRF